MPAPSLQTTLQRRLTQLDTLLQQWDLWEYRRQPGAGEAHPAAPPPIARAALEALRRDVMKGLNRSAF